MSDRSETGADPGGAGALDARELRLLALKLQGLGAAQVARAVGMPEHVVESAETRLQRKLQIEAGDDLADAVKERLKLVDLPEDEASPDLEVIAPPDERRVRLLLRMTLEDVLAVAADADVRATMLADLVAHIGSSDPDVAAREAEELKLVARALRETVDQLLAEIRSRD